MLATAELNESVLSDTVRGEFRQHEDDMVAQWPIPRRAGYVWLKVAGEWFTAAVLLVVTSPLLLVLALLVKLTSEGPAFYAQTRLGRHGRRYRILKLRTMVHNAEGGTGPVWAAKDDRRITPLGRFLRNTHLDELPQLLNVISGHMSLIGPRPERPEIAGRIQQHVPNFSLRLGMRPGVTGLAQMLLPADDPDDREFRCVRTKLNYDLYYLREVSFLLDLRIVCCTGCYFLGAAIDSVRHTLMRSYRAAIERTAAMPRADDADCEQAA